jgi:hypothetical protein
MVSLENSKMALLKMRLCFLVREPTERERDGENSTFKCFWRNSSHVPIVIFFYNAHPLLEGEVKESLRC